jgi:BirA family biotin operon repressor/biotin-[acetyl-CoA-carboxylase] ligase
MPKIIYFDEITSTNDYLKEHYHQLDNYTICTAGKQTAGRGRMGRSWVGNKDENIALSILIKDFKNRIINIENITLLASCALHQYLSTYINDILIKWPNDLLIKGKKISGILTEGIAYSDKIEAIIIGIGININQIDFIEELKNLTTSLKLETNITYDIKEETCKFACILEESLINYFNGTFDFIKYYKQYLYGKNELITFQKNSQYYLGKIIDVDENGKLIIEYNNIIERVSSGEIKIIRK